jgi:SAM-dependent methyltransferase
MNRKTSVFEWIERELEPRSCNSEEIIYDDIDSQSGRSLPVIYQPFDASQRSHWRDRGSLFDYLYSTGGKKLLDFGPGDGWPSLIVAPYVDEIQGVDGAPRRVQVCTENAKRLGISNVTFAHVAPGAPLPFEDESFDGVMAASSIEETEDPEANLRELFRVLRPAGRLRMSYEALSVYKDGRERESWLFPIDHHTCRLILYDRHVDKESVTEYGITFAMSHRDITQLFSEQDRPISFEMITVPLLEKAGPHIQDARICTLPHPCGKTMASFLENVGFREIIPSHSGADLAGRLFDELPKEQRPTDLEGVDAAIRPLVKIGVQMAAPLEMDPMITAVK